MSECFGEITFGSLTWVKFSQLFVAALEIVKPFFLVYLWL